jgi:hypothetical protein
MLPPAGGPPKRGRPDLPNPVRPPRTARDVVRYSHTGSKHPPQGGLTPAQRSLTPMEEAAFAALETELGGRSALVAALSAAHLPKGMDPVLGLIADPIHQHESLGQICALAGVRIPALLEVVKSAALVKGQILATQRVAMALPDVAAAVMLDATPGLRDCGRCLGARYISKPTNENPDAQAECPECQGTGTIVHRPDHDVQKTALKIGGLLGGPGGGKAGGVNVAVLQSTTQVNPGDSTTYDAMIGLLDRALYGEGRDRLRQGREQTAIDVTVPDRPERRGAAERRDETPD